MLIFPEGSLKKHVIFGELKVGGGPDKIILTGGVNNSDIIDIKNVTITDRMLGVLRNNGVTNISLKA